MSTRKERILEDYKKLIADLDTDELPAISNEQAKALQFYTVASDAVTAGEKLQAIYNAYGVLYGFRGGAQKLAAVLGMETAGLKKILSAIRGDEEDVPVSGRKLSEAKIGKALKVLRKELVS